MNTLVIEKKTIQGNINLIKKNAAGATLIGDLSADAYGLGLVEMARLMANEGVRSFAVSGARDAEKLRDKGFTEERLMTLRPTSNRGELEILMELGVVCAVGSYEVGLIHDAVAESRKNICQVQILVDSGLNRYGFKPAEIEAVLTVFESMNSLSVEGVFSSFSSPAGPPKRAQEEFSAFMDTVDAIVSAGHEPGLLHMADGASLERFDYSRLTAVRIGQELGGILPRSQAAGLKRAAYTELSVEDVGWSGKGERVGDNGGEKLKKPCRLAILPIGSYGGFGAGGELFATIGTGRAPVVGNVGLFDCAVDVTDVECRIGDVAVVGVDPVCAKGLVRVYR